MASARFLKRSFATLLTVLVAGCSAPSSLGNPPRMPVAKPVGAPTTSSTAPATPSSPTSPSTTAANPTQANCAGSYERFFACDASWNRPASHFGDATGRLASYGTRFWKYGGDFVGGNWKPGDINMHFRDYSVPIYDLRTAINGRYRAYQAIEYQKISMFSPGTRNVTIGQIIPYNPAWIPGTGTDRLMIAVNPDTGETWEFGGVNLPLGAFGVNQCSGFLGPNALAPVPFDPGNPTHICFYGIAHYYNLYAATDGTTIAGRGMGINKLALLTRASEVARAVASGTSIGHALEMTLPATMPGEPICPVNDGRFTDPGAGVSCGTFVTPATVVERAQGTRDWCGPGQRSIHDPALPSTWLRTVPEGLRIRLEMTDADIVAWLDDRARTNPAYGRGQPLRATAQAFARTFVEYGAIVAETGCAGIGIETEGLQGPAKSTWAELGIVDPSGTNPYPAGDLLYGLITEARIRVVQPPEPR